MIWTRRDASSGDNLRKRARIITLRERRWDLGYLERMDASVYPDFEASSSRRVSIWDIVKGLM